jgi:Na+/H+-translocating membrane pyrophosphatase
LENLYLIILAGIIAVVYSYFLSNQIVSSSPGNSKMQEIAEAIQIGAKAYLNRQYKTIAIVGVVVLIIISYFFSILVGLGYLIGALLSGVLWLNISSKVAERIIIFKIKSVLDGLNSFLSIETIFSSKSSSLSIVPVTVSLINFLYLCLG